MATNQSERTVDVTTRDAIRLWGEFETEFGCRLGLKSWVITDLGHRSHLHTEMRSEPDPWTEGVRWPETRGFNFPNERWGTFSACVYWTIWEMWVSIEDGLASLAK